MQKSKHGQPIKTIIEHLKHEHQAKKQQKDEERKHAQFMREAEEKKALAEQEILAEQKKNSRKESTPDAKFSRPNCTDNKTSRPSFSTKQL